MQWCILTFYIDDENCPVESQVLLHWSHDDYHSCIACIMELFFLSLAAWCSARSVGETADQEDQPLGKEIWTGSICESQEQSLSHTHHPDRLQATTQNITAEHCYSNFYLTSCNFAFEGIAFFFTSTTWTAKICCVVHVSLYSVTLASTAPSGKALGLGRCATVLQELSATSSCWSAYESDDQLICVVLCIISKRKNNITSKSWWINPLSKDKHFAFVLYSLASQKTGNNSVS